MNALSIGKLAAATGIATSAIRYYERVGVLPPARRRSGARRYDTDDIGRLRIAVLAREAGFSIEETRDFLSGAPGATPAERWRELAARKMADLDAEIALRRRMKRLLAESFRCGCLQLDECARLASQNKRHVRQRCAGAARSSAA